MLSLNLTIPTNTTVCDFFMFEISEYKKRTQNYTTKLNSLTYAEKLQGPVDKLLGEVRQNSG